LLVPLQNLKELNLRHTGVTLASLETYKSFPNLKDVVLGVDQWSGSDFIRFRSTYPKINLHVEETEADALTDQ
jgi:hypothetical protein